MWRKNRSQLPNSPCVGVDLNRQFPVGHLTTGGSSSPCASTYASTAPLDQDSGLSIILMMRPENIKNCKIETFFSENYAQYS